MILFVNRHFHQLFPATLHHRCNSCWHVLHRLVNWKQIYSTSSFTKKQFSHANTVISDLLKHSILIGHFVRMKLFHQNLTGSVVKQPSLINDEEFWNLYGPHLFDPTWKIFRKPDISSLCRSIWWSSTCFQTCSCRSSNRNSSLCYFWVFIVISIVHLSVWKIKSK